MAKNLEQIKKAAAAIRATKAKNHDALTAAESKVESVKAEMAAALTDGNIQLYSEKAAALEKANVALKTAQDTASVTDAFPEVNVNDVVAAWDARRPALDKDIQKAEKEYQKAMETFKNEFLAFARVLNRCRTERDEYAELIAPDAYPKVKYTPNTYFNEHSVLPAEFKNLVYPFDTGKMHPRVDEPLKWYLTDESVKAAAAVAFSNCASSIDF